MPNLVSVIAIVTALNPVRTEASGRRWGTSRIILKAKPATIHLNHQTSTIQDHTLNFGGCRSMLVSTLPASNLARNFGRSFLNFRTPY